MKRRVVCFIIFLLMLITLFIINNCDRFGFLSQEQFEALNDGGDDDSYKVDAYELFLDVSTDLTMDATPFSRWFVINNLSINFEYQIHFNDYFSDPAFYSAEGYLLLYRSDASSRPTEYQPVVSNQIDIDGNTYTNFFMSSDTITFYAQDTSVYINLVGEVPTALPGSALILVKATGSVNVGGQWETLGSASRYANFNSKVDIKIDQLGGIPFIAYKSFDSTVDVLSYDSGPNTWGLVGGKSAVEASNDANWQPIQHFSLDVMDGSPFIGYHGASNNINLKYYSSIWQKPYADLYDSNINALSLSVDLSPDLVSLRPHMVYSYTDLTFDNIVAVYGGDFNLNYNGTAAYLPTSPLPDKVQIVHKTDTTPGKEFVLVLQSNAITTYKNDAPWTNVSILNSPATVYFAHLYSSGPDVYFAAVTSSNIEIFQYTGANNRFEQIYLLPLPPPPAQVQEIAMCIDQAGYPIIGLRIYDDVSTFWKVKVLMNYYGSFISPGGDFASDINHDVKALSMSMDYDYTNDIVYIAYIASSNEVIVRKYEVNF